jgi:uroporphyrinogen-III synthase
MASATSASAVRGGSYNVIFLDEFAHVPPNVADEFFSSVYPTITSGQTTKVIIVSTPNGLNMFYSLWQGANQKTGRRRKKRICSNRSALEPSSIISWWSAS